MSEKTQKYLAVARIALGFLFLWAFFDKMFGLGFATKPEVSVLNGGSATEGFLSKATSGWFANFYQTIASNSVIEWLFLAGLFLVGIAFFFGIAMRLAVWAGSLMVILMWSAVFPPKNNPLIDEHTIYLLLILAIGQARAGDIYGLGKWWGNTSIVRSLKFLG